MLKGISSVSGPTPPVLGLYPQAYKPCIHLTSRPKEEPRVRDRDTDDLMDGRAGCGVICKPEARSWSDTPSCMADSRENKAAGFSLGEGKGGGHQLKVIDTRWPHQLLGKLTEGHIPHSLFNKLQVEML